MVDVLLVCLIYIFNHFVFQCIGRTFPVEQLFLEDVVSLTNYRLEEYSQFSRKVGKQSSRDLEQLDGDCDISVVQRRNYLKPDPETRDDYLPASQFYYRYKGIIPF